jgi:MarR family transcriptional regulator, transcriptional regulator for hemolysin
MESKVVIHELYQSTRFLSKVINERLQDHGLFQSQWSILFCLKEFGPMSQTDIWKYLNVEAPTVTRTINKLEENGWVLRKKGEDKREKIVILTEKAISELPKIEADIQGYEENLLQDLTAAERKQLVGLLRKVGSTVRTPRKDETNE